MKTANEILKICTKGKFDFIDLTDQVKEFIKKNKIRNGLMNIQTLHTTCPLLLNENEPLLLKDFKRHLARLSPRGVSYCHDDFTVRTENLCKDERKNGRSHCLAMHLPPNLTLNVIDGQLQLGQWQRIFLAELDGPRKRKVQIQIMGE